MLKNIKCVSIEFNRNSNTHATHHFAENYLISLITK